MRDDEGGLNSPETTHSMTVSTRMEDPRAPPLLDLRAAVALRQSDIAAALPLSVCADVQDLYELDHDDAQHVAEVLQQRRRQGHAYTWLGAGALVMCGSGRTSLYTDATIARFRQAPRAQLGREPHLYALAEQVARDTQRNYALLCVGAAAATAQQELLRYLASADSVVEFGNVLTALFCGVSANLALLYADSGGHRQVARWTLHPPPYNTVRAVQTAHAALPAALAAAVGLETHAPPERYALLERAFLAFGIDEQQQCAVWRVVRVVALLERQRAADLDCAAELLQLPRAMLKYPQTLAQRLYGTLLRWLVRQLNHPAATCVAPHRTVQLWCEPTPGGVDHASEFVRLQLLHGVRAAHQSVLADDGLVPPDEDECTEEAAALYTSLPGKRRSGSRAATEAARAAALERLLCDQQLAASPLLSFAHDTRSPSRTARRHSMYNLDAARAASTSATLETPQTLLQSVECTFANLHETRHRWVVALGSHTEASGYRLDAIVRRRPRLCARRALPDASLPPAFGQTGVSWRWLTLPSARDYERRRHDAACVVQRWWRACALRFWFLTRRGVARAVQRRWRRTHNRPTPSGGGDDTALTEAERWRRHAHRVHTQLTPVAAALRSHFGEEYRWEVLTLPLDIQQKQRPDDDAPVWPLSQLGVVWQRVLCSSRACTAQIGQLYWATVLAVRMLRYAGGTVDAQRTLCAVLRERTHADNALAAAQTLCCSLAWAQRCAREQSRDELVLALDAVFAQAVRCFAEPLCRALAESALTASELADAAAMLRLRHADLRLRTLGAPLATLVADRVVAVLDQQLAVRLRTQLTGDAVWHLTAQLSRWVGELHPTATATDLSLLQLQQRDWPLLTQLLRCAQLNTSLPELRREIAPSLSEDFLRDGSAPPAPRISPAAPGSIIVQCATMTDALCVAMSAGTPAWLAAELRPGY